MILFNWLLVYDHNTLWKSALPHRQIVSYTTRIWIVFLFTGTIKTKESLKNFRTLWVAYIHCCLNCNAYHLSILVYSIIKEKFKWVHNLWVCSIFPEFVSHLGNISKSNSIVTWIQSIKELKIKTLKVGLCNCCPKAYIDIYM